MRLQLRVKVRLQLPETLTASGLFPLAWAAVPASQGQQVASSSLLVLTSSLPPSRWLSYLLLFILDLVICLVTCLGLARHSKCLLAS